MIVGNGMIAKAFKQYIDNGEIIIFASGVSNSREQSVKNFNREFELLKKFINTDKKLIYFSTCSVFDNSLKDSEYIKHKIKIELFIESNFNNYLIFRLPNVVGESDNASTSFNFFKNKILKSENIEIQKNATRYFIDIDDLIKILPFVISDEKESKKSINICFDNKIKIKDFITLCKNVINKTINTTIIEGGMDYEIDNSYFISIIKKNDFKISSYYNIELINKYLAIQ